MLRIALTYDSRTRPETTGRYCLRPLERLAHVQHFEPDALAQIEPGKFDLFLNIDDGMRYRWPERLKPAAWWAIDTHMDFEWCLDKSWEFDFVFAAQRDGAERLKQSGIDSARWLPLACDPETQHRHDVSLEFDVSFVGNLFPGPRSELVELLQQRFGQRMLVGQRYFEEMARTYSASKTVFNRSIRNDINMRVFEALACGSLLVTNDLSDNGQAELFTDGVHLATYTDAEELLDKLAFYLSRDEVRERIAAAGRAEVLERHTYRHRIEQMLAQIGPQLERRSVQVAGPQSAQKDPDYFEHARPELLALVCQSARKVLDIGCGRGALGAAIKARQPCHVTGVEREPAAASVACQRLDRVVAGDIEDAQAVAFDEGSFDCIVCGDVLEHLESPEDLLHRAHQWLAADGRIVASIPNVRHWSVVSSLLEGNFTYEPAGLLDETHLRLFTKGDIHALFEATGFEIESVQIVPGPGYREWQEAGSPGEVSMGSLQVRGMPPEHAEEFFVYQYLVLARPAGSRTPVTDGELFVLPLLDADAAWQAKWHRLMSDPWLHQKLNRQRRLREHVEYLRRHVPELWQSTPGYVVDLGPGSGELLEIARALGHEVLGVDAENGTGGMGDAYLAACRLVWQRQGLDVQTCGARSFFHDPPLELLGRVVLLNSRGSLEQMLFQWGNRQHLEGPPHDLHHDASRMTWRIDPALDDSLSEIFACAARLLAPGGMFLIHGNGAQRASEVDQRLTLIAARHGLRETDTGPNLHRWVLA